MVGGVQDMARKVYLPHALRILGCTVCVTAACAAVAALKYKCMDHDAYTFGGSICLDDSQMRAVVSALLTFALFFMALLVADAIEALRSAMLARSQGINEGVYIAMVAGGSMALRLRTCFTRYALLMLMIALLQYGPEASQTLSSLAIKTVPVFVNTSAVATLPPGPYRYNDTPDGLLGSTLGAPPSYSTALDQIRGMSQYAGCARSTIETSDTITTAVVKTGTSPLVTKMATLLCLGRHYLQRYRRQCHLAMLFLGISIGLHKLHCRCEIQLQCICWRRLPSSIVCQ